MCCFSGRVDEVDGTSIFARLVEPGRQLLVYELSFSASTEVAMVLPLPVPAGTKEDGVSFIDMKKLPNFFAKLEELFTAPAMRSFGRSDVLLMQPQSLLKVHDVGDFVASYVPSLADFTRLDPRFRMPAGTLDLVPEYADWGFAVFQLASQREKTKVHPMAFAFPTRERERLFFPTLHVHDGMLLERAVYAHKLYAQGAAAQPVWRAAELELTQLFMKPRTDAGFLDGAPPSVIDSYRGVMDAVELMERLVDPTQELRRRALSGDRKNEDTWAPLMR